MRTLFDDELGGSGLNGSYIDDATDSSSLLARRILSSGRISLCQVTTITEEVAGESRSAKIEFRSPGRALIQMGEAACWPITVASNSYSFSTIRNSSALLIGKSLVIFSKDFVESELTRPHWHAELYTPELRNQIDRIGLPLQQQ